MAPGHIVAPREGYADYPANTLHDRYNAKGRVFSLSMDFEELLGPEIRRLLSEDDRRLSEGEWRAVFEHLRLARGRVVELLESRLASGRQVLFRGDSDLMHPSAFGVDLGSGSEIGSDSRHRESKEWICTSPNCFEESEAQRLVLVLVGAAAIREVLEAYSQGQSSGSEVSEAYSQGRSSGSEVLGWYCWERMEDAGEGWLFRRQVRLPRLVLPFGEYERVGPTRLQFGFAALLEAGGTAILEGEEESGRGSIGFEWLPLGVPPGERSDDRYSVSYEQWALGLGGAYRLDEGDRGLDATIRIYRVFTRVDLHVSMGVRLRRSLEETRSRAKVIPEIRLGKTYGFFGVFVGVLDDVRGAPTGGTSRGLAFQGGVQFAIPWWRAARRVVPDGSS